MELHCIDRRNNFVVEFISRLVHIIKDNIKERCYFLQTSLLRIQQYLLIKGLNPTHFHSDILNSAKCSLHEITNLSIRGINLSVWGSNLLYGGNNISLRGNDFSRREINLTLRGINLSLRGNELSTRGNHFTLRGIKHSVRGSNIYSQINYHLKRLKNNLADILELSSLRKRNTSNYNNYCFQLLTLNY